MTVDEWITVALLGVMFGLLIGTKLPPAAVFVGALTVALTFDLAPAGELLKGFSNQGVLTVGAMSMAAAMALIGLPFAITVKVGASCSFISPIGYQTNLMVYEPGGYKFTDFARMGVPLTVLVGIITIWLTPIVFPF
jgi:di/tricarboxylate transporter